MHNSIHCTQHNWPIDNPQKLLMIQTLLSLKRTRVLLSCITHTNRKPSSVWKQRKALFSFFFLKIFIYLAMVGVSCLTCGMTFLSCCKRVLYLQCAGSFSVVAGKLFSWSMWDLVPWPGIKLHPLRWKRIVRATGPPVKSQALSKTAEVQGLTLVYTLSRKTICTAALLGSP